MVGLRKAPTVRLASLHSSSSTSTLPSSTVPARNLPISPPSPHPPSPQPPSPQPPSLLNCNKIMLSLRSKSPRLQRSLVMGFAFVAGMIGLLVRDLPWLGFDIEHPSLPSASVSSPENPVALPYLYHYHPEKMKDEPDANEVPPHLRDGEDERDQGDGHPGDVTIRAEDYVSVLRDLVGSPYISTVREEVVTPPRREEDASATTTPNAYDLLARDNCLPQNKECFICLREKTGSNCKKCARYCRCYCERLCSAEHPVPEKVVSKRIIVHPPERRMEEGREIPKIVHQTYYETTITRKKHPNMSRLIESWKHSGWQYIYYDDDSAAEFISTHFPPEVREAYDSIKWGAFKADLFRYCALLIQGGIYADTDILLESNLNLAVTPDIGFMVPIDDPGSRSSHQMCLWNGLLAVAPGHPYLAKVIELVVNNIRNRFTVIDYDNMMCPDPELSISHAWDTLFPGGPCILGAAVNSVLGNPMYAHFKVGDYAHGATDVANENEGGGEPAKESQDERGDDARRVIPGRTVFLQQNKKDMGAHRFSLKDKNMVVAATDMEGQVISKNHYSNTHVKYSIYGVNDLYTDTNIADEELKFFVALPEV